MKPETGNVVARPRTRRQSKALSPKQHSSVDWFSKHQILVGSLLYFSVLFLDVYHPSLRKHTQKFFKLSHPTSDGHYRQGIDDIYFVAAWIVNFFVLRAVLVDYVLQPIAKHLGIAKKSQLRFAEQGWLVLYYAVFWTMGLNLWKNSEYWLDNQAIWHSWPNTTMSATMKFYYLGQLAFWLQQIIVIHMEARRNDHAQMLTHHFVTSTLIGVSYTYRYTNVGNVVLVLMDVVDLLLPTAKMLRYLGYELLCNAIFGLFVITWFLARHVMYPKLCYDIYLHVPAPYTMEYGCYSGTTPSTSLRPDVPAHPDSISHLLGPLRSQTDDVLCLNKEVKWIFLGFLLVLQAMSLVWFGMIVKVIWGRVMGNKLEDSRSDDEGGFDSEEDEENVALNEKQNLAAAPHLHDPGSLARRSGPNTTRGGKRLDITDLNVCVGGTSSFVEFDDENTMSPADAAIAPPSAPSTSRLAARGGISTSLRAGPTCSSDKSSASRACPSPSSTGRGRRRLPPRKELLNRIGCDKHIGS